ncbi:MAG: DUF4293 family protein [Bacteroidetes bacterium]|nr:DUF4293 family protein [Bacteroidota bacterium]
MIQRVQSLYYLVAMILLGVCLTGQDIYRFSTEKSYFALNAFGFHEAVNDGSGKILSSQSKPFYIVGILMVLFIFYVTMSYKKLNRQLKLARYVSFLYLALVIAVVIFGVTGNQYFYEGHCTRELGPGFSILVVGFPFCFLAQLGIKRDKKLLDSLNRLR